MMKINPELICLCLHLVINQKKKYLNQSFFVLLWGHVIGDIKTCVLSNIAVT